MTLKKSIRKIHLWLGFVSGLLVFIIAITGCIYAYQEEIQNLTEAYRYTALENKPLLAPSKLEKIAKARLPQKALHSLKYFNNGKSVEAIFYHYEPTYYYKMYLNPYSGKVLHTQNMEEGFFDFILKGHMYLWLPREIGAAVVLVATLIFFVMVVSGLVLWFPVKKSMWKPRMWFRWKATTQWKRKNWDLHAILGFYSCLFALAFIMTGLVWVMPGFADAYHKTVGGKKTMQYQEPHSAKNKNTTATEKPLDKLFSQTFTQETQTVSIEVHPPETDSSSILVVSNTEDGTYWKSDYRYYDQYSLQELPVKHIWGRFDKADNADKILRLNYDLHVGAVLGLTGKTIAFFASLLIASLPITGILIWWGRRTKKTKISLVKEGV